jgi:thiol:disulfide interchange protein DsbA
MTLHPTALIRRFFSIALLAIAASTANAQQGYENLTNPVKTDNPEKIEVLEFFWYGCPHCYQFEPHIKEWLETKPENVEFKSVAAPLNPAWKVHSQAFYAAEILGVLDQFHEPMFDAIHKEKKSMRKPKDIAKLAESLGLDGDKFAKTMKSFAVDAKIRQSMQKAQEVGISAVPTVIINGKYRTSGSVAGSYPNLIKVLNQLIAQESEG